MISDESVKKGMICLAPVKKKNALIHENNRPTLSPYLMINRIKSNLCAPKNIPTRVTSELEIEIIGRKNRCSILPAVCTAATALGLLSIIFNIKAPIAIIIIDKDEGTPIVSISLMIAGWKLKLVSDKSR